METSLAIETPEGVEKTLLSASSIDFHDSTDRRKPMEHPIEEECDLLDLLCDLADEHESFISTPSRTTSSNIGDTAVGSQNSRSSRLTVTTPILDIISSSDSVEDLPFDDDSVLGTQHSRTSPDDAVNTGINDPTSDSDEDRETLEMSQIFEETDVDSFQRNYYLFIYFYLVFSVNTKLNYCFSSNVRRTESNKGHLVFFGF